LDIHKPRVALGANSARNTGAVELTAPSPKPATMRATMRWARVKAVACRSDPTIMTTTPIQMLHFRPSCSPKKAVKREPKKAPTKNVRMEGGPWGS
jgi:hypothetical protein